MSRWINQFDEHPFQIQWSGLRQSTKTLKVSPQLGSSSTQELARYKKVVKYIDEIFNRCDPELIPASVWGNIHGQINNCLAQINNYKSNNNIAHIQNANANLDQILAYISPYANVSKYMARSVQAAFRNYSKTISDTLELFLTESGDKLSQIEQVNQDSKDNFENIEEIKEKIESLEESYFGDTEDENLSDKINRLSSRIDELIDQVNEYYTELYEGDADNEEASIIQQIEDARSIIEDDRKEIELHLQNTRTELNDLGGFYDKVFGVENEEGEKVGGLEKELQKRNADLDEFDNKQRIKHNALIVEIRSLLPDATSAGLASSYRVLRKFFSKPIKTYSILFYCSIGALLGVSFLLSIDTFFPFKLIDVSNSEQLWNHLLLKIPFFLPLVWLTLFASKRRSEALRLQQEYAHKEAIAKSYQSFKKQIDELGEDKSELLMKLLEAAITSIEFNASKTLDGNHGDKIPAQEVLEKFMPQFSKNDQ